MSQLLNIRLLEYAAVFLMSVMYWIQRVQKPNIYLASERSEPSSRAALMGEQPNPWDLLQPQDETSRHRGAEPRRRCGRLGGTSLLSPE